MVPFDILGIVSYSCAIGLTLSVKNSVFENTQKQKNYFSKCGSPKFAEALLG